MLLQGFGRGIGFGHAADVAAGAESAPRAGDHHDGYIRIGTPGAECIDGLRKQLRAECVQFVGTVECQGCDTVLDTGENRSVTHVSTQYTARYTRCFMKEQISRPRSLAVR